MKFSSTSVTIVAALSSSAAAMQMSGCTISHNSGDGGNQFTVYWNGVPSQSQSTICGHFSNDLYSKAAGSGVQVKGSVACATRAGNNMDTILTLNKQSCQTQANVIVQAMQQALGSAGTLGSGNSCNFASSGC